jgi:hemerythrin-like metal-binding protein
MPVHAWDQRYATGIPSIDEQHRWLFSQVQQLYAAYRTGRGREAIPGMIKSLTAYCQDHFMDEEAQMRAHRYPGLDLHREEHRKLMVRVDHLGERFAGGESDVAMELSVLVSGWLKDHIQEQDQAFAAFLRRHRPDQEAPGVA